MKEYEFFITSRNRTVYCTAYSKHEAINHLCYMYSCNALELKCINVSSIGHLAA